MIECILVNPRKIIFIIVLSLSTNIFAAELPKTLIAIMPFKNDANASFEWLSVGIADTLISKFTGVPGLRVVERENLDVILGVDRGNSYDNPELQNRQLQLCQAQILLVGSYTVMEDEIRLNARIVASENSKIVGNHLLTVTGKINQILDLQTELAQKFAEKCQLEVPMLQLTRQEGFSYDAYQAYNQAKLLYQNGQYPEAVKLFRQAQQLDQSFYFAEAHTWEGKARLAMAQHHRDAKAKQDTLRHTVDVFEADAAAAAPAFYDLGTAYQATGQYEKAIAAYDQFLRWYDQSSRPFRWEDRKIMPKGVIITEEAPYYYEHGKREREQSNLATASYMDNWRYWICAEQKIYYIRGQELVCRDLDTGKEFWNKTLVDIHPNMGNSYSPVLGNFLVYRNHKIYFSSLSSIVTYDGKTGELLNTISTGFPKDCQGMFYVFDKENVFLISTGGHLFAYSMSDNSPLWKSQVGSSIIGAYKNEYFYSSSSPNSTTLIRINLKTGESTILGPTTAPICQIWPEEKGILMRCSSQPRVADEDRYFNYIESENRVISCSRSAELFFSSFYHRMPLNVETRVLPIMDAKLFEVQFLKAALFYPRSIVESMDKTDYICLDAQYNLPNHRKLGDQLISWSPTCILRNVQISTGKLLWSKVVPDSTSGIDISEHYIVTKAGRNTLRIFSSKSTTTTTQCVSALTQKGICFEKSGQIELGIPIVKEALINAYENVDAQLTMARMLMKMGNMNEALEHYAQVFRFALSGTESKTEASAILKKTVGLNDIITAVKATGMAIVKNNLYYSYQGDQKALMACYDLNINVNEHQWPTQVDTWRNINEKIYYYDSSTGDFCCRDGESSESKMVFNDKEWVLDRTLFCTDYGTPASFEVTENIVVYKIKKTNDRDFFIRARDLSEGKVLWEKNITSSNVHVSILGNELYISESYKISSNIHQYNLTTGRVNWSQALSHIELEDKYSPLEFSGFSVFQQSNSEIMIAHSYRDKYYKLCINPKVPFYTLNSKNGCIISRFYGPEFSHKSRVFENKALLRQGSWSFGHAHSQNAILGCLPAEDHSYHLTLADFHEVHPKVLAQFEPLKDLSKEYNLKHHIAILNSIIDNGVLRKQLIDRHKFQYLKRGVKVKPTDMFTPMGAEPLQNTLRILLEQKSLTLNEEKFATRQLMSLWRNREPFVEIRAYRYPSGCRFFDACLGEGEFSNFAFGHYRGVMMAASLSNDYGYLCSWKRMPQFYPYHVYYSDVNDMIQKDSNLMVRTNNGIFIYNPAQLINYMQNFVVSDQGYFTVGTHTEHLGHMMDEDRNTTARLKSEDRVMFGCDFGIEQLVKSVNLEFKSGEMSAMEGAYIQASTHSETGGYYNIGTIPFGIQTNQNLKLTLNSDKPMRYLRIVSLQKADIEVAEFSVEGK